MRQTAKILILFLSMICLISCDDSRVFDQYKTINNGSWNIHQPVKFEFLIEDTISKQNLFLNLRNNNTYSYSNLFLITKITFPDNNAIIDTLEYEMTDKTGRFLGSGFTEIKENKLFYKENITFPSRGNYILEVSQAMRKNGEVEGIKNLQGITELGFRIEKTNY